MLEVELDRLGSLKEERRIVAQTAATWLPALLLVVSRPTVAGTRGGTRWCLHSGHSSGQTRKLKKLEQ